MAKPIVSEKRCGTCKGQKPLSQFYKSTQGRFGVNSICKPCSVIVRAERYRFKPKVSEKQCLICEEIKPASEFYVYTKRDDGLHYQCKACSKSADPPRKYCPRCHQVKLIDQFSQNKRDKHGKAHYCKPCAVEKGRENYWIYHEREKKWAREYSKRPHVRASRNAFQVAYRKTVNGGRRLIDKELRNSYGIGLDDYERMLANQNGLCAICRETCSSFQRLCVDHDHRTGNIRGLLCRRCNTGIAYLRDDPETVRLALEYLKTHQSPIEV